MRLTALVILVFLYANVHAQSWFNRNFEINGIELKFGQSGITKITWDDGMYGASVLKHLNDGYDNGGLKQNRLTTNRPFDVEYRYYDYGDIAVVQTIITSLLEVNWVYRHNSRRPGGFG
ncbi:MAG: hypothetical protein ACI8SE_000717 [Bacteroidia bacterium]|jgi:hypothetical protein